MPSLTKSSGGQAVCSRSPAIAELYGNLHRRIGKLRQHGVILEFHHGMDNALRMHDDFYLFRRRAVEPHGLGDFEPLVDHGRAVDRDAPAHIPVGVFERLRRGYGFQFFRALVAEGPAGRR